MSLPRSRAALVLRLIPLVILIGLVAVGLMKLERPVTPYQDPMIGQVISSDIGPAPAPLYLVNFFASWCFSCQVEQADLTKIAQGYDLPLIGIAYKDKPEATALWLEKHGNPFARVLADETGHVGIDFGITGVPETILLDRDRRVLYRHAGPITTESFKSLFLPLLGKDGKE